MDFYSCVARRTRSGTDLYFRTISKGGSSARRASSRGSDSRTNVEDRASGCGSASNSEVRKSGRKRKKVTFYEPDDEDDCLFVGEGESREEQGDSVLFGSQLRSEKAKKGRFGSSVDGLGGLFGEKDMEDGDDDKVEVIVIDESDGSSSEDDFYGYENSGDEIRSVPDSAAAAFGDENVINVDGEPFEMKKGACENSGDEIRSEPYSAAAAFGGENFINVDKEPFEMREAGYENSGDDIRSEPCSAAVFGGENVINVDGEPFEMKKSAYENAGDEIRYDLAAALVGQNFIIVDKEPFEMQESAYENSGGEIRSEPDSAAAAFGGENVINVDVEPFEMKEGAYENSGDEIRSEPDLAAAFGGEKVINVDGEPFEMKKSAYENAGDEIRYEPYLAAAFCGENFIIADKEPFEMKGGLFEKPGDEIRSEPDSAKAAFGSENVINVDAVPFEKKEDAYENSGDDIRPEPDSAAAFGGEKVINVDEEPFDMKEAVESIDLTKDDENDDFDDFELIGRAGIGSRLWKSDPAGLGSFGLESPIVSKWIFGESSCVTPVEKKFESLRDKGKNVLEKDGGNDQDVSGVSPMPSKVGESGFESFDLTSPVVSKGKANGNNREKMEFESLGNDKGKKAMESDGGNGQDVSGVSPMPSKVGESPLEVSESESSSENDSDIFSSSSSSDDDDSQDEDYKANKVDYTTSEDEGLSFDDDDDELSDFVEENVADSRNEKEASVSKEDEKKSSQLEPPLKKRKFSSRENEAEVVTDNKDMGAPIVEEEKDKGVAMDECVEEREKELEVENQASTFYEKNEETGDEGAAMGECMEEVEKEVEAENEASPFCEKNEETGDDGATKEECSEKEVEAEIDASSICEKNVETRDDGFTDEVCGNKEEEEEIEADYEASSSCEKISETRIDGGTMEERGKKDEGVKERCREKEEEKEVETSSIGENNGETRDDGATKEMYWERKATKRVGVPFFSSRERKATRVGIPVFSGKESEKKQQLVTRSSVKRIKIPGEKSNLSGAGRPTAASRENIKKVYGSTATAASRESLKKVYGSTKTAKEVEDGDKRNDEFIVSREEKAQKTVHSSTKFSEEESKKQEWQDKDEEEEEGKGDKIGPEGRDFSCKRKGAGGLKDTNIFRLLLDSITEKGEAITDHLVPSDEDTTKEEDTTNRPKAADAQPLPLKFTFGVEEPEPLDKSESEKELDMLWAEMDFALKSLEIGSSVVEDEEMNEVENGANLETLCKHDLILDEQIGIKCRFCSFVKLEIRYVLPPMAKFASEGLGRKSSYSGENVSMFDGVQLQDLSSNPGASFNQTKGSIWDIIPNIKSSMYPHQQEGFEFIWKNLAGTTEVEKLKSSDPDNVGGCIISHAPGTGKTRLTIVFLQTYLEMFPKCRPVIIAPASLLLTWEEEFKKWNIGVPFHNLNSPEFSGKESAVIVKFLDRSRHQTQNKNDIRMVKLFSWCKDKSILGVSYSLYEKLAGEKFRKDDGTKKRSKVKRETETEDLRNFLLDLPGLLVLDEGHTPRNQRSSIWKVLCELQTKKRIILSGTPFQNNFLELYNTLCLVRPGFADTTPSNLKKLCQRRLMREKRVKGEVLDSTSNSTGSLADEEIKQFKALLAPFVHVHKGSILQKNLPGLRDCVVVLNPPDLQKRLLEGIQGTSNTFEFEHRLALASVHPSLFQCMSLTKKEESILDQDWLERQRLNPNEGVKTRFLMEFVRLCDTVDEKILVFSQFIDPLCLIMDQLNSLLNWCEGRELLYMHGKLDQKTRQFMINKFNDPNSEAKVLLASTKACSEGINLVGASRVVLLDVVWNPSVERQAISRAYRIGQKKVVYTYHLITRGTTECDKYCKQAEKDRLSELVFSSEMVVSSTNKENDKQKSPAVVSDDKVLDEMIRHDKLKDMFEKIIYQPKESDLVESFGSMVLP